RLARAASAQPALAVAALASWALLNLHAVLSGHAGAPGISLILGLLGACAIIAVAALLHMSRAALPLAYCGRKSIVVYLGFYIPLVLAGKAALWSGWFANPAIVALLATAAGVGAPLVLHRLVRDTRLAFLFERPERFWLVRRRPARAIPVGETA
ncbi:MAG TPA: hypothetical protein VG873_10455, partial [Burkholderiales bacterium]|nr:hypothetical protein [Burkholderiales bacterium]